MEFDFDPKKDLLNRAKHGLTLAFASELCWDEAVTWIDDRYDYDGLRMIALVPANDRMYYVAFVDLEDQYRIISLRHANRSEIQPYIEGRR
jgi:uncharacterized protein